MNRKIVSLILAGVLALAAGVAVVLYASRADDRAIIGQEPSKVWVVTETIPRGTTLGDAKKSLKEDVVPVRSVPSTAVETLGVDGLLATTDIPAGEILLDGRFAQEKLGPEILQVPTGHLAVGVELSDQERVAAFVRPGDDVAVFYSPKGGQIAYTLLPRAQVLGIGSANEEGAVSEEKDAGKDSEISTQVLTLSLTPAEATKVVAAAEASQDDTGHVYFGLLPAKTTVKDAELGSVLPKQFQALLPQMLDKVKSELTVAVSQ